MVNGNVASEDTRRGKVQDFEYLVSTAQENMECGKEESPGWRKVSGMNLWLKSGNRGQ